MLRYGMPAKLGPSDECVDRRDVEPFLPDHADKNVFSCNRLTGPHR
jgi:hypothetical protein